MALIPLLSHSDAWPRQSSAGLHSISAQDYQRNLSESFYEASDYGIPSPLAQARVFAYRLEQYLLDLEGGNEKSEFADAFDLWQLLLQGLYLGVIHASDVDLDKLRELGRIVRSDLPEGFPFRLLKHGSRPVGITFPRIGFAPSARLQGAARAELHAAVQARAVGAAADYLAGWVHTFDDRDQGDLPFYRLLYRAAGLWAPGAPGTLPLDPAVLFARGPRLWLGNTEDDGDAQGLAGEVALPELPLYQGTPVICDHCGHTISGEGGVLEVSTPEECRCPECQTAHDWLQPYRDWIRYDEEKGCFLIYALEGSPARTGALARSVELKDDGVVIRDGGFAMKVLGLVITESALKCRRLTFFHDGERVVEPHLPVPGEYYGLVTVDPGRHAIQDRRTGDYVVRLRVRGWDAPVTLHYRAKEIQHEEALLLTWPNFNLPGWSVYYYLLEPTPQMNKAGIRLRSLSRQGRPKLLAESRGQLEQPFEAFEIVFAPDGEVQEEAGIFTTARVDLPRGEAPITLALDYGTSATALWYRVGDGDRKVVRFKDFTETLVPNRQLSDKALKQSFWLPTYRLDDPQTAARFHREQLDDADKDTRPQDIVAKLDHFLPSELILTTPDGLDRPLSGFRLCHLYANRPPGDVVYELKTQREEGDPEGRFSFEQAVTSYLEVFLIQALAAIINAEPRAGHLKLRASFPRAFTPAKVERFLQCIERTKGRIAQRTGFATNSVHYVDEARAAAWSMKVPEGFSLVLDMGGGTTDLGLFEWRDGTLQPIFVDSLYYGGNSFLRILAGDAQADLFPKATEPLNRDHRLLWLFREIRLRGFQAVVTSQYRANTNARKAMLDLLYRFYSPLAHFVSRLFEALTVHRGGDGDLRKTPVAYYLVGNGWSLADALPNPEGSDLPGRRAIFRHLLELEGFSDLTPVQDPTFEGWPGPKGAVGYGLLSAEERLLYRSIAHAAGDAQGVSTITGFDFHLTNGSERPKGISWHQQVPFPLTDRDLRPVLSEIDVPESWRDFIRFDKGGTANELEEACGKDIDGVDHPRLTRSPLARFLEQVYLPQLPEARRY